jgi:hypothetical protein
MQIQGSINQLLSMSAVAVRLSPLGEKMAKKAEEKAYREAEQRKEQHEWEKLTEKEKSITQGIIAKKEAIFGKEGELKEPLSDEQLTVAAEELHKSQGELLEVAEEQFKKRPSVKGYEKIEKEREFSKITEGLVKGYKEEAAKKEAAKEKSKVTRQQKAQQKAQESLAARQFEINILKGTPSEYRLYKGEKK